MLLSLSLLSTYQATTTSPPGTCHILIMRELDTVMGQTWCWHPVWYHWEIPQYKHNFCILNDKTHLHMKPQALGIDLTISTPGLAMRSAWCPCLIHMAVTISTYWLRFYHQCQRYYQAVILPIWLWKTVSQSVLGNMNWDILEEADPLHSFVKHITNWQNPTILK